MITVSVPGKIHLMGEHAVVYGKPALLAAVNLRLTASVEMLPSGRRRAADGGRVDIISDEPAAYVKHAAELVQAHLRLGWLPPVRLTIRSEIPAGYHLGSSAAVAVASVGALLYAYKQVWNPQTINQLAYEAEKKMHGNPSGGDNTAVTLGGFVWYRRELEFLKSIWQLPFALPRSLAHFFLINTGRPRETTGEMVALVRSKVQSRKFKARIEELFSKNEEQVRAVAQALKEGSEDRLLAALTAGERTLEGMGVVAQGVKPLIRAVERAGGAAKILGGGGVTGPVGFLLGYHRDPASLRPLCQKYGYTLQPIRLGADGVRLEEGQGRA